MNINEKNLATWIKANGGDKPNREALQLARSLQCEPRFDGANVWHTASISRPGITHTQTVYFAGLDADQTLGLKLNIECTCPAIKNCIHAVAVERRYGANWKFYFHLFGLSLDTRMGELHSRATAVAERMTEEFYQAGEIDSYYDAPSRWSEAA